MRPSMLTFVCSCNVLSRNGYVVRDLVLIKGHAEGCLQTGEEKRTCCFVWPCQGLTRFPNTTPAQDDFYLNLVDWSQQNVLTVALGKSVYLWSACTSQVG